MLYNVDEVYAAQGMHSKGPRKHFQGQAFCELLQTVAFLLLGADLLVQVPDSHSAMVVRVWRPGGVWPHLWAYGPKPVDFWFGHLHRKGSYPKSLL